MTTKPKRPVNLSIVKGYQIVLLTFWAEEAEVVAEA